MNKAINITLDSLWREDGICMRDVVEVWAAVLRRMPGREVGFSWGKAPAGTTEVVRTRVHPHDPDTIIWVRD